MSESYSNLIINHTDIEQFACFSHDVNPLHVDEKIAKQTFFQRKLSHGVLVVLKTLFENRDGQKKSIFALDIEFRRPIFPEIEYQVSRHEGDNKSTLIVREDDSDALIINIDTRINALENEDKEMVWFDALKKDQTFPRPGIDTNPLDKNLDDLHKGEALTGSYRPEFSALNEKFEEKFSASLLTILGLCSYLVGMKSPGLRSLFTRLTLDFTGNLEDEKEVFYHLQTKSVDPKFRMLENHLTVCSTDGGIIATGSLKSYVRFCPVVTDFSRIGKMISSAGGPLSGKTALVCGGSKGLGAEIAIALAFSGCTRVFATYYRSESSVLELKKKADASSLDLEFIKGDAGDISWCEKTAEMIQENCGGLDILILNAATPPDVFEFGKNEISEFDQYIAENLKLVQRPLNTFLELINSKNGIVAAVSSSFVVETPKEFPHYVALKQAVEGMIHSVSKGFTGVRFLLPRPPKLQTSWNDTPTGVLGTIPTDQVAVNIVQAMHGVFEERVVTLSDFPPVSYIDETDAAVDPDFHVVVSANFTADSILNGFKLWYNELNMNADVVFAPYNQILQELINPNSLLSSNVSGAGVILLRIRDWLRELDPSKLQSEDKVRAIFDTSVDELSKALKTHRSHCKVESLLMICPVQEKSDGPQWSELISKAEKSLINSLIGLPGLTVLNAKDFHHIYSVDEDIVYDTLREKIGHIPYQKPYYYFLSTLVIRNIYRKMLPICKVVVVDCDNTLWKGVVGEIGAEGVVFEASHKALQKKLVQLSQSGIVVGLCSKNEPFDVWSVFDNREDFILKRENIVSAMVNWQPKSENIKGLAKKINLGLDSFIFIDDNPVECAEVSAACPEVLTIQWPQDSEKACALLNHIWEMDVQKGTAVDQKRTQMYKEELKRQEFMEERVDFGEFLKSLKLKTDLRDLNDEDLARASQLTMRTNQFNFTTRRRKEGELKALMSDKNYVMQTVRVSDRFGDYGLVGFYIGEVKDDEAVVDTFLLSCRVLGRGVEHYMLNELGRFASEKNIDTVRIEIFPTPRNTPAREFLKSVSQDEYIEVFEDGRMKSIIPSNVLEAIELVPSNEEKKSEEEVANDSEQILEKPSEKEESHISREEQIKRAAYDLSDMTSLVALTEGKESDSAVVKKESGSVDKKEIERFVYEVFSKELKIPVETLKDVDNLEDLGCDSFKIVEITVLLIERYPWIPETLLFEHRSISDIVIGVQTAGTEDTADIDLFGSNRIRKDDTAELYHDIAVIGLSFKCAGGETKDELWNLLSTGGSAIKNVQSDRQYFLEQFDDTQAHWAGLIDGVDKFDAEFFGISPREAALMDPQTRLTLEISWRAMEETGYIGDDMVVDTGVYMGVMYSDYVHRANQAANIEKSIYRSWETFSIANRLSHFMGFRGPSFTVDTACSSSGTALHLACKALRAGECGMAVAGGVNLILNPNRLNQLDRLGILSPTGKCRPFCEDSNGVLLGEGAGVVVLKPLTEALKDNDHVYGVIKGSALSSGTGSIGFTAPNPNAQSIAISKCIKDAGIDPRTVSYIEAHGTGTALGDPIEVRGLTLSYGNEGLWDKRTQGAQNCTIGSVKANIGHLESAAGVLGLIKLLLQIENKSLAPSITSGELNSKIQFSTLPFDVQKQFGEWQRPSLRVDGKLKEFPRRAGLSSFGVGGANSHIIIEEPPNASEPIKISGETVKSFEVFMLSAKSNASLVMAAQSTAKFIDANPEAALPDICYTSGVMREQFKHRAAFLVPDTEKLSKNLKQFGNGEIPVNCFTASPDKINVNGKMAFLFTGQGSQYNHMGYDLYHSQPVFKTAMDECAAILDQWLDVPLFDIIQADENSENALLIDQTQYTQVALFSIEYAITQLWFHWGAKPDYLTGHSAGEIIALTISGILSLEEGLMLIYTRGKIMQALPPGGKMVAVRLSEDGVLPYLKGYEETVAIASVNSPEQTVLSGKGDDVDQIIQSMESDQIEHTYLKVSHAFHSPMIAPMLDEYLKVVESLTFNEPDIPVVSCVDGAIIEVSALNPEYWRRQVRDAVRFQDAMNFLDENNVVTFVEIGPHPVLSGMGSLCLSDNEKVWLPSLRRKKNTWQTMGQSLSKLYTTGRNINWKRYFDYQTHRKIGLPSYQFNHGRYWLKTKPLPELGNGRNNRLPGLLYALAWEENSLDKKSFQYNQNQNWLIISEAEKDIAAETISAAFESHGCTAIRVIPGPGFVKKAENQYVVRQNMAEDFDRMVEEISQSLETVHGVILLWPLEERVSTGKESTDRLDLVPGLFPMLLNIVRTCKNRPILDQSKLWLVTRQGVSIDDNSASEDLCVGQSLLWGFGRGLSLEHPNIFGGLIDLSAEFELNGQVDHLISHLFQPESNDQICLGKGRAWVPRLKPEPLEIESGYRFYDDCTYLITGGLGVLGKRLADWMVSGGAKNIILTSRNGLNTPGAVNYQELLQQQGVNIQIVALDIGNEPSVSDFFRELISDNVPLKGVFHLAGIDQQQPVMDMDIEDILQVFKPKVHGTWHLHQYTLDFNLDLFVCFSSISAVLGSENRSHYGAANAFIDSLMHRRRLGGLPGLSINWGPWDQGGMADPEDIQTYSKIGNFALDPEDAIQLMEHLILKRAGQKLIADIDWPVFSRIYEARRTRPLIQHCKPVIEDKAHEPRTENAPWIAKLEALSNKDRFSEMIKLLSSEISQILGYEEVQVLPANEDLTDIGIDSLVAVELSISIQNKLGFDEPLAIYEYPNVEALANGLLGIAFDSGKGAHPKVKELKSNDGVIGYNVNDENEILDFFYKAWPKRDQAFIEPRWRWMYLKSAEYLGIQPMMWSYKEDGNVIGFTGAIPVKLKAGDSELRSAWFVDTMVLESFRDKGLGPEIVLKSKEDIPFNLSLGQTEEMRNILFKLGWEQVAPLQIYVYPLKPYKILKGKMNPLVAGAADIGFQLRAHAKKLKSGKKGVFVTLQTKVINHFNKNHDRLWDFVKKDYPFAVIRDSAYMNWKYVDQPGQVFTKIEILKEEKIVAVAILMVREPGPHTPYKYRRAYIVDIVAPLSNQPLLLNVIDTVKKEAAKLEADSLIFEVINSDIENALKQYGFIRRDHTRYFLIHPEGIKDDVKNTLLSPEKWVITKGDSDIDRPEGGVK